MAKETYEQVDLEPGDDELFSEVRADGEPAYALGLDVFHDDPYRLIAKYGRDLAVQILSDPRNRTPA